MCCYLGDGNRTLVRMAGPGEVIGYPDYIDEKGCQGALFFEAQVASKCTLALFSREHLAGLLAGFPADALISILTYLNTFLVREPPAIYRPAEPSLLGPAKDRDERSGEAGRGKGLRGDNSDSRNRTSGAIRDDRLLAAIGDPYDSRNGQIGIACAAKKAVRSAQTAGLRP